MARISSESPLYLDQQIASGLLEITANKIQPHWTVINHITGMTHGGLHEKKSAAHSQKNRLVNEALRSARPPTKGVGKGITREQAEKNANYWRQNAEVIYLDEGDKYSPHGERVKSYKHGKDDGHHGSKR